MERNFLDVLQLASRYGDGAREEGNPYTWPVTEDEVTRVLFAPFQAVNVRVLGTDLPNILDTLRPNLAAGLGAEKWAALARRLGWCLWVTARKAQP